MQHDRDRHGHSEHQHGSTTSVQDKPKNYSEHEGHDRHGEHDKHAGHNPEMFKRRFFICLLLTFPVLYFAPSFQEWFNYQAIQFPGSAWVTPILTLS